ncbi:MAG: hypothetical protein HN341_13850 [Verrucomicrobia bacterium]|jgi:hypothetical protein|nr:hypothetical protein [Verrucomicrobiota bacterium]
MQIFLIGLGLIATTLVIFLAGRGVACWYWRINRIIELLESVEGRLKSMDSKDLKMLSKMDALTQQIPAVITTPQGGRKDVIIRGKRKPSKDASRTQVLQIPETIVEVDCPYCEQKTEVSDLDALSLHKCQHCGQAFEVTP